MVIDAANGIGPTLRSDGAPYQAVGVRSSSCTAYAVRHAAVKSTSLESKFHCFSRLHDATSGGGLGPGAVGASWGPRGAAGSCRTRRRARPSRRPARPARRLAPGDSISARWTARSSRVTTSTGRDARPTATACCAKGRRRPTHRRPAVRRALPGGGSTDRPVVDPRPRESSAATNATDPARGGTSASPRPPGGAAARCTRTCS